MSAQDRRAEREVADFYDAAVRPPDEDKGPRWPRVKRFGEGFLTGYAVTAVLRKLF
jgi:hypothetical protein